jgi:hypothetical protein
MQQEMLYAWATAYRQAGWCVLPAKNKHPILDWKPYQEKLPSLDQVQEWFSNCPEDAQIALVTGKISDVTVIDIDTHKAGCAGKKGDECTLGCQTPEYLLSDVGYSLTSRTGSGGYHVFCEYTEYAKNSVGLAHPQLDIRSDGGIIILPPSLHENGNEYAWWDMAPWTEENLKVLMPFPPKYKLQLIEKSKTDWLEITQGVGQGKRNDSLAALIGKLIKTFGMEDVGAAYEIAWLWNEHRCDPPQSEKDFRKTFDSIANAERNKQ